MEEHTFFVRIKEPNELRRTILECSKEIIQNLKTYHKILSIREKKLEQIRTLKSDIKEINLLMDKLRDLLPVEVLRQIEKSAQKEKVTKKKGAKKKKVVKPSEVARLENALSSIEEKLKGLS